MRDVCRCEAVALQKHGVLRRAPLPALAHAEGVQQAAPRAASVFIQEDLTEQEPATCQPGGRKCMICVCKLWQI